MVQSKQAKFVRNGERGDTLCSTLQGNKVLHNSCLQQPDSAPLSLVLKMWYHLMLHDCRNSADTNNNICL